MPTNASSPGNGGAQTVVNFPGSARSTNGGRQPGNEPGGGASRVRPSRYLKYLRPDDAARRRKVAWIAMTAMMVFLGLALLGFLTRTTIAPLPIGSFLLLELALHQWRDLWILAVAHNLALAAVAGVFWAAVTTAHSEIPEDPRSDDIVVWRRQVAFVCPQVGIVIALAALSVCLHLYGEPMLAAVAAGLASPVLVDMLAKLFVPIILQWVVVVRDSANLGLGARIRTGGGLHGMRHGEITIPHERLRAARCIRTPFTPEWLFGLATLELEYWNNDSQIVVIRIRHFAATATVERIAAILMGEWRNGLSELSRRYPAGFHQQR